MMWGRGQQTLLVKGQTIGILSFLNHAASVTSTQQHPWRRQREAGMGGPYGDGSGCVPIMARSGIRATVCQVSLDDGGTRQPCPQGALSSLRDRD